MGNKQSSASNESKASLADLERLLKEQKEWEKKLEACLKQIKTESSSPAKENTSGVQAASTRATQVKESALTNAKIMQNTPITLNPLAAAAKNTQANQDKLITAKSTQNTHSTLNTLTIAKSIQSAQYTATALRTAITTQSTQFTQNALTVAKGIQNDTLRPTKSIQNDQSTRNALTAAKSTQNTQSTQSALTAAKGIQNTHNTLRTPKSIQNDEPTQNTLSAVTQNVQATCITSTTFKNIQNARYTEITLKSAESSPKATYKQNALTAANATPNGQATQRALTAVTSTPNAQATYKLAAATGLKNAQPDIYRPQPNNVQQSTLFEQKATLSHSSSGLTNSPQNYGGSGLNNYEEKSSEYCDDICRANANDNISSNTDIEHSSSGSVHENKYTRKNKDHPKGRIYRGRGARMRPGDRSKSMSHEPNYNQQPPPLISTNSHLPPIPFGPHCSGRPGGNAECFEMQRSRNGSPSYGPRVDYRDCNRGVSNLQLTYNDQPQCSSAEYTLALRNNNTNVVFNLQRENYNSRWTDNPQNDGPYGPNRYEEECSPYSEDYFNPDWHNGHNNWSNNAMPPSSASGRGYEYRRNSHHGRRRLCRGRSPRTHSSEPAHSHRDHSVNKTHSSGPSHSRRDHSVNRTQSSGPPHFCRDHSTNRSPFSTRNEECICPTCSNIIGLQIYKCHNEHSSCKNCKLQCRPCGVCGDEITFKRDITLERNVSGKKVPCPNQSYGCVLVAKMTEVESHTQECSFQELKCPIGCHWRGRVQELSNHVDGFHCEHRSIHVASEIKLRDFSYDSQNVYLILIGKFNFLFHVKVSAADAKIYMTVQLIDTKVSASKWTYEVHVYNKNEPRRKYVFTDACHSFVEPVTELYEKGICSVIHHAYASTFINNGFMAFKIYIKKNNVNLNA